MNQNEESYLDKLVAIAGIEGKYYDARGEFREISSKTKRILLSSMELPADDEEIAKKTLYEHEAKPWKRVTPPVAVVRTDKLPAEIVITLPAEVPNELLSWVLEEEDGYLHTGTVRFEDMNLEETRVLDGEKLARRKFILPVTPSLGYHKLLFEYHNDISGKGEMTLIVVPPKCYMPSGLDRDINTWGFPVQLYALNSKRNWGIGDFTDLEKMITTAANLGAGIVGINPVNTLFPDDPNDACPYGSCSRHFLNFMYIDVEGVLEFADSSKAKEFMDTNEFKSTMEQVKKAELIDYVAVASLKQPVLEILYNDFLQKHIKEKTSRGDEFKKFCMKKGLEKLAVFQALSEKIAPETPTPNWRTWSKEYRNSNSDEVVKFAEENRERIDFFKYLQWESDRQLTKVSDVCWSQSMEVGLYQDLAVGVAGHSAETWAEPELFADEIFIGSPPDDMNPEGQEWGLSPFTPMALQETAYEPFKRIMHANMRFAGALRLDHVMGLRRLYWTVSRDDRVHGGYVAYPFEDLLGIVCLESHRRRCIVVGEDLGAVPDGFRERLLEASILSFRLFCFERHWDTTGEFKKPEEYPVEALAAAGTHDLPTLNGYWLGKDIELGEKFGHFVCKEEKQQAIDNRKKDRTNIIKVLKQHEVLPEDIYKDNEFLEGNSVSYGYVEAIYRYLARTPCPLLLVQMEDVLGQETQVNLPNTTMEYPNWRRRLPVHLENLADDERVQNICAAMREERPVPAQLETAEDIRAVIPAVPASTYRIQFSPSFILYDAERLVPYLSALGVTHVYSSPFMKAVSGSEHGYNIVDYNQINSEIGGKDALDQLSDSLKRSGIGLILDFVPNHMGITNGENPWWQDVMEWGKQSPNAKYFDIDWNPAKKELKDKVLVPLLGNYYGKVLENGELHLVFDRMEGTFCVWYNEQRFPICPSHYGYILEKGEDSIEDFLSEEVRTLVEDFNELGVKGDGTGAFREKRCEKATELKQRLAEITNKEKEASKLIENSLLMFNGITGNTKSFNELHLLLEKQAYRICYWRVASNEVNYRRFFSINELAGLRVDLNEVFDQIHVLLFKLITEGKLQGLRIDHIDGLLNPKHYLDRLCSEIKEKLPEKSENPFYMLVEKILAPTEELRKDWAVAGTTGYDYMNQLNGLFVDPDGKKVLDRTYGRIHAKFSNFDEVRHRTLIHVMNNELAAELNSTAMELDRISEMNLNSRDFTLYGLREALKQFFACFPVYRTYVTSKSVSDKDIHVIDWTVAKAKALNATINPEIFDFIRSVLTTDINNQPEKGYSVHAVNEFAMRVQQFTGPVMAKGMEDTAFYRYQRLISLNEVGGEPDNFGVSLNDFHKIMENRVKDFPHSMLATSTHDTKRGEDARARINVLSEIAREWSEHVLRWFDLNSRCKTISDGKVYPSLNDEYMLYQALIGVCPLEFLDGKPEQEEMDKLKERLCAYMVKAMREAKMLTDWPVPNETYENAVFDFIERILDVTKINPFIDDFLPFVKKVAEIGAVNSLSQTLVKLASVGVPDIYQGCETWDFSLVDPDNRRPIDHAVLTGQLSIMEETFGETIDTSSLKSMVESWADGRVKLFLTWKMLQWRRKDSALFIDGEYIPLQTTGDGADQLIAFARKHNGSIAVFIAPRFVADAYDETETMMFEAASAIPSAAKIVLPDDFENVKLRNILTGREIKPVEKNGKLTISSRKLFANFPVAALEAVL